MQQILYNINVPSNVLSNGHRYWIRRRSITQSTTNTGFTVGNPLSKLYLNIGDCWKDLVRTVDTVYAPPIEIKNYNSGHLPIKRY